MSSILKTPQNSGTVVHLVILVLGKQRHVDPESSLVSQPRLFDDCIRPGIDSVSKWNQNKDKNKHPLENDIQGWPLTSTCRWYLCVHMYPQTWAHRHQRGPPLNMIRLNEFFDIGLLVIFQHYYVLRFENTSTHNSICTWASWVGPNTLGSREVTWKWKFEKHFHETFDDNISESITAPFHLICVAQSSKFLNSKAPVRQH